MGLRRDFLSSFLLLDALKLQRLFTAITLLFRILTYLRRNSSTNLSVDLTVTQDIAVAWASGMTFLSVLYINIRAAVNTLKIPPPARHMVCYCLADVMVVQLILILILGKSSKGTQDDPFPFSSFLLFFLSSIFLSSFSLSSFIHFSLFPSSLFPFIPFSFYILITFFFSHLLPFFLSPFLPFLHCSTSIFLLFP
jgi:hypothetical protein